MSCPTNFVGAAWPLTWFTRNWSLMCILLKSPVRSWTVTSVTRPTSLSGVSVGVSPRTWRLNISGARRLYHTFAFHLSLILRAAARDFFSAIRGARRSVAYLRVLGRQSGWRCGRNTVPPAHPTDEENGRGDTHRDKGYGRGSCVRSGETEDVCIDMSAPHCLLTIPRPVQGADVNLVVSVWQHERDVGRQPDRVPDPAVDLHIVAHDPRCRIGARPVNDNCGDDARTGQADFTKLRSLRIHAYQNLVQRFLLTPRGDPLELDQMRPVGDRKRRSVRRPRSGINPIPDRGDAPAPRQEDLHIGGEPPIRSLRPLQRGVCRQWSSRDAEREGVSGFRIPRMVG